ncbi:hypothetical protein [Phormidium sp. FACHB-1136]|jgi:hypothetical protein|uniref:hypothetical protein n=1 Tax=Phormidium sp. FACHB-1136 TaxID=2692848 RepID=UPI0016857964|nr:hypothetical protein [Phormidium sp. FACHB-1136]MBD2429048.1 hypothetical protein [Phormidium sp. FACHB-1136]
MRLSNYEADFFNRLKNVRLSARDHSEIRLRSPALADALAEYQQKHSPSRPVVSDLRNILPELHPNQIRQQQQIESLHRLGYAMDLEGLKANNPWVSQNTPAMLIIEQMRPDWAVVLRDLARKRLNRNNTSTD